MANLGNLEVGLTLDNKQLNQGAADSERRLGRLNGRMASVAKGAALMGGAVIAAGTALGVKLVKDGLAAIDTANKLAVSLRGTYDEVRALQIVASDSGVDGLEKSLTRLNRRLGGVETNGGPAIQTMEDLGLSAEALGQMNLDDRIAAIADAIADSGMSAQEAARHLQQLGFDQAEAVEMFMQGGDAIRAARREVDEFGLSISQVDAAQIERANDAMSRIGRVIESVRNAMTIALAPILAEVAERFNNIARENKGFGDAARDAIETGIRGFARVGDVIQGLRVVVKGVEVAFWGLNAVSATVIERVMEGFTTMFDSTLSGVNTVIDGLNKIPNVDIAKVDVFGDSAFMRGIRTSGTEAREHVFDLTEELRQLAMQQMPSDRVEEFLEAVRQRSLEAAEEVAEARETMLGKGGDGEEADEGPSEAEQRAEELHQQRLADRLERIREANMTEQELLEHRHAQELEMFKEAEAELVDSQADFDQIKEDMAKRHQDQLTAIEDAAAEDRKRIAQAESDAKWNVASKMFGNLGTLMSTENRKLFRIGQVAAASQALIDGRSAVLSSYKEGAKLGGPVVGAAFAATAGIATATQIASIANTSYGSGAGATNNMPSGGDPAGGAAQPQQSRALMVQGDFDSNSLFTGDAVRGLMDKIAEAQRDGYTVVI